MSKYNVDDIIITVYDEIFRVLEVLPYDEYRGLRGDFMKPIDMYIAIRREDELKKVVGKARYSLYRVFDAKIDGVDDD